MTEAEWLTCTDPQLMLEYMRHRVSERKLRLFACGCCRRIWYLLDDARSQRAVQLAERFADDECSVQELDQAWRNSWEPQRIADRFRVRSAALAASAASTWYDDPADLWQYFEIRLACTAEQFEEDMQTARTKAQQAASWTAAWSVLTPAAAAAATKSARNNQAELLRDVLGNPFNSVLVNPFWVNHNGGTVHKLAQMIYHDRCFEDLPILADALEDAGCDRAHILEHCRSEEPHVRGCWVIDLLLRKG